jgi:protein-L-isoaspartate(D-aspartate) O-methyltransferase
MNLESARQQMIEQQVRAWDVLDARALATLAAVPRERFVPEAYRDVAFADIAIPIGHGQHLLTPKVEGRILQALDLRPSDVVLEVGTGTGFFAACLAHQAGRVRSLELLPDLAGAAADRLRDCGYVDVVVETADATQLAETDRYDAVVLTASLPVYDERYQRALKVGGRLFVVIGAAPVMEACLITRISERSWQRESLFETVIDPLLHSRKPSPFVF